MGKLRSIEQGFGSVFGGKRETSVFKVESDSSTRPSWNKGSIEHPKQPTEGRDLHRYEEVLNFSREDLRDKHILDLGAGPTALFARGLRQAGIQADVVSLSPDYASEKHRTRVRHEDPKGIQAAGLGGSLPFTEMTFDRVFALHVFEHVGRYGLRKMVPEIARVLQDNGNAIIGPVSVDDDEVDPFVFLEEDSTVTTALEKNGVTMEHESIPLEIIPLTKVYPDGRDIGMKVGSYRIILNKIAKQTHDA